MVAGTFVREVSESFAPSSALTIYGSDSHFTDYLGTYQEQGTGLTALDLSIAIGYLMTDVFFSAPASAFTFAGTNTAPAVY